MFRLDRNSTYRPRLLLAYVDSAHAVHVGRYFRRLGWEVRMVASAAEAHRLAPEFKPRAMVLDTELPDESGWLTCAKVTLENPDMRVVLLGPQRTDADVDRLTEVHAESVITRDEPVEHLAECILGEQLAHAV